ncbi:hypothetical protein B0H14DRAFT_2594906 [Mycena olivaceomarginata]|nr:hypothetical protein B0H14DRAFT_2594906 [Mycena olivaceomarginata]
MWYCNGMFSRPNHHHQSEAATCLPAPQHSTTLFDSLQARDDLLTHHQHLETLLDSALATFTLIHEAQSTTDSPIPFSPHLLGVLHLSCRLNPQTPINTTIAVAPTPAASATTQPVSAAPATYAAVTQSTRSPTVSETKEDWEIEWSRLGQEMLLYYAIKKALGQINPLRGNAAHERLLLAGVHWTKNGNIALHPAPEDCTAKFLAGHKETIWSAIRPLLGFAEGRACPTFDTDDRWFSVIFHGVPAPSSAADAAEAMRFYTRDRLEAWAHFGNGQS